MPKTLFEIWPLATIYSETTSTSITPNNLAHDNLAVTEVHSYILPI